MARHDNTSRASAGVSFDALLRYNELETACWGQWFRKQPAQVLQFPAGDSQICPSYLLLHAISYSPFLILGFLKLADVRIAAQL